MSKFNIAIFLASKIAIVENGVWASVTSDKKVPITVSSEDYQLSFDGEMELDPKEEYPWPLNVLERIISVVNSENRPEGYKGNNMWVGDIIRLEGEHYICKPIGFQECEFIVSSKDASPQSAPAISAEKIKKAEQILIDNGIEPDEVQTVLQALGYVLLDQELYPEN